MKAKANEKKNLWIDLKYLNKINFEYFVKFAKKSPREMFKRNVEKTSDVSFF